MLVNDQWKLVTVYDSKAIPPSDRKPFVQCWAKCLDHAHEVIKRFVRFAFAGHAGNNAARRYE